MLLGPCPHVSGYFWKLKKYTSTQSVFKSFSLIHMKTLLKTMEIWLMMYLWCMTLLYSKTSVFICPLAKKRLVFSKISTLESVLKRCVFGDRIWVDSRPNRRKSNVFFQTKRMRVDRAYYYFLCELPDVIKLCQTTRRCVRHWRPVRNETPVIHG